LLKVALNTITLTLIGPLIFKCLKFLILHLERFSYFV
jgi:hypothetical protein